MDRLQVQYRQVLSLGIVLAQQYKIDTVLGAGGFGITYIAQDVGLNSVVVIKEYFPQQFAVRGPTDMVYPRSTEDESLYIWGRGRFIREARILDSCRHPNIVRVRRVFEANNTAYMALDYEDGPNLENWLRGLGRRPTQMEMDAIARPITDALGYLHGLPQPIIHRDVAPDNIIMRGGAQPVLIDFGAARIDIANRSQSKAGTVKVGYSPKELYAQRAELQGPWTDIYAMGATLWRAIKGHAPPDSVSRDLQDDMPTAGVGASGESFRPGFLKAVDRAMALRHQDRPQTVGAWQLMLFHSGEPVPRAGRQRHPEKSHVVHATHALAGGTTLPGQYQIDSVLSTGVADIVYLAHTVPHGSRVVVREYFPHAISSRQSDASLSARTEDDDRLFKLGLKWFRRQAESLQRWRHPNNIAILNILHHNNTIYSITDEYPGPSLEDWFRALHRAPSQSELDAIARSLTSALENLHGQANHIVSPGIEPECIVMRNGADPIFTGWGTTGLNDLGRPLTGRVKANAYLAVEEYGQHPDQLGAWSHIYALAAIFWRGMMGRPPPDAISRSIEDTMPLAGVGGNFRPAYVDAVTWAMAVHHDRRPRSIAEWRTKLLDGANVR